jgi:hypothetical protein
MDNLSKRLEKCSKNDGKRLNLSDLAIYDDTYDDY